MADDGTQDRRDGDGLSARRSAVRVSHRADETETVRRLIEAAALSTEEKARIEAQASALVAAIRAKGKASGGLDAFLQEYELSNNEGVVLMCLAEALLRVPDPQTASLLIKDKLLDADWADHLGRSESLLVNASTWALMLTGKVMSLDPFRAAGLPATTAEVPSFLGKLVARSGEPVIRQAVTQAMRILGQQFVMGRTIAEALARAAESELGGPHSPALYSYDMLGEAARTGADAERYFRAYQHAIEAVGEEAAREEAEDQREESGALYARPGVSVKLSALHPRYELVQRPRVMAELLPRLLHLCRMAKGSGIGLCIDAEEADRLELSLDIFEAVSGHPDLGDWNGLGLAVQAYQKRALPLLKWLALLALRDRRRLMVRLVKGAYWDTEIKRTQEQGLDGYPVFTRKASTDVSYLACARFLLANRDVFFPQFATHNAHTLAAVREMADGGRGVDDYEFQRLHGMGEALYEQAAHLDSKTSVPCRIYAPVGPHEDLLAYLVRRLLENGANTSFVNRLVDEAAPISQIVADPVAAIEVLETLPHPAIPLPRDLYGAGEAASTRGEGSDTPSANAPRVNSAGVDFGDPGALAQVAEGLEARRDDPPDWRAAPPFAGDPDGTLREVSAPQDPSVVVGQVFDAGPEEVDRALSRAVSAAPGWAATPVEERAACLKRAADLMEQARDELLEMCVLEAGKTVPDAIAEVREAVDFCRYYACEAKQIFATPSSLPGPTGESNQLSLHGRGVFVCISPWNFPLAIFAGQVTAALAAGNAVIAKPAEQTSLIAAKCTEILHQAGVPEGVLTLLPGSGPEVGQALVSDPRVSGVAFTGSTETASAINQSLAARPGPIVPLIAETGGQNAMIVDSTALPEQVVEDVIASAFKSAGQRCSALRVLFLQDDIADKVISMLGGACNELAVGDPAHLETDVGPVIDARALAMLEDHAAKMDRAGTLLCQAPLGAVAGGGTFFAPRAYEIEALDILDREVFGPLLHVIRYPAEQVDQVVDAIGATGYGLTLGVHSRVDATVRKITARAQAGNIYVNRNMIGAVVGVQPFGGEGLSGTGPKAGGPHYLFRFATERTLTINTAAAGGNAALMRLDGPD